MRHLDPSFISSPTTASFNDRLLRFSLIVVHYNTAYVDCLSCPLVTHRILSSFDSLPSLTLLTLSFDHFPPDSPVVIHSNPSFTIADPISIKEQDRVWRASAIAVGFLMYNELINRALVPIEYHKVNLS